MRTVLLVAAEPREFDGLLARCGGVEKPRWPVQWRQDRRAERAAPLHVANGAGPRRAAQAIGAAREAKTPDAIVSFGFCGALEPGLEVGDIFAGTSVRTNERCFPLEQPHTRTAFHSGVVVSVNRVAQTAEEKRGLRASGASVVEMEAAGVLEAAEGRGPPSTVCARLRIWRTKTWFWTSSRVTGGRALRYNAAFHVRITPAARARPGIIAIAKALPEGVSIVRRVYCRLPDSELAVPARMQAAVYRGNSIVRVEEVPTPEISDGEILIRVEACGICHTDLKKIEYNLLDAAAHLWP